MERKESEDDMLADVHHPSRSARTHVDSEPLPTDSLVTISLSEADADQNGTPEDDSTVAPPKPEITVESTRTSSRPSSLEIFGYAPGGGLIEDGSKPAASDEGSAIDPNCSESPVAGGREGKTMSKTRRPRSDSSASDDVDWEQLNKKQEEQPQDEISDESTALLLARLEQENNAIATNPKSGFKTRARSQSRPPSLQQLRRLVENQGSSPLRYSLLPAPPPMTELDFWGALVRDYPQTAQRLPTLTSNKIRAGIPAPLRGIVWVSMAGARDKLIEEQYERLCGESSPYENIINKDIGRSFPGVEMFRDPEGEGQKMLGRVLKCFSLYDHKIGYCQGLGFLVGPLLMQMGEKEAFCVLIRLMEDYDLRSCFLPDLSGLHLRIYQFQRLLHQHAPKLAAHLDELQVEAAYLSQWFLSFFAVTCPLPMLFRIYDVIFAEGASETIMRVALSIMRRNEKKILAFTEFEDVMQLLLSRALWDPYGRNAKSADELVNDFVSFTSVVTRESLQKLEVNFREAQKGDSAGNVGFFPGVQTAASKFLGRLWTSSNSSTKSLSLSPGLSAPSRPGSFLRRTPSKQSLASTLNSIEGGAESMTSASTAMTEATSISRDSTAESFSIKSHTESMTSNVRVTVSSKDKDLHGQIEDLLTALSEMQRDHSLLAAQLQKEHEERREDHRIIRSLVDRLKKDHALPPRREARSRRMTTSVGDLITTDLSRPNLPTPHLSSDLVSLICTVDDRFTPKLHHRKSSAFETKQALRDSLARSKEQLHLEASRSQVLSRQLADTEQETTSVREQLREARQRLQKSDAERQRLEKTVQELRRRRPSLSRTPTWSGSDVDSPNTLMRSDTGETGASSPSSATSASTTGLREFKLCRSGSSRSQSSVKTSPSPQLPQQPTWAKRSSSLATQTVLSTENHAPAPEDALLLELVNSKTAEAVARQELDELKGKFEALRRAMRDANGGSGTVPRGHKAGKSEGGVSILGFGLLTPPAEEKKQEEKVKTPSSAGSSGGGGGWFWGKRSVSSAAAVESR